MCLHNCNHILAHFQEAVAKHKTVYNITESSHPLLNTYFSQWRYTPTIMGVLTVKKNPNEPVCTGQTLLSHVFKGTKHVFDAFCSHFRTFRLSDMFHQQEHSLYQIKRCNSNSFTCLTQTNKQKNIWMHINSLCLGSQASQHQFYSPPHLMR